MQRWTIHFLVQNRLLCSRMTMTHLHVMLLFALVLTVGSWPRHCRAVDVGETEKSSFSCPNVTTVSISSNKTSQVQLIDASTCTSSVVAISTSSTGVKTLDLRHQNIAAVSSLPSVDVVRLDNNELRTFTTSSNISEIYMSNNSIPAMTGFKFPAVLTVLDIANNALGDLDGVEFPTSLHYLNLSGNPVASLSNVSFPTNLLHLDVADSRVATLENFSFPSSVTALNFSGNPITTIRGVIFPDSLTTLTLIATANSAVAMATSTESVVTPEEARVLQTTKDSTVQAVSVLEEFEVRQSDADMFEKLTHWDVSTTSTLSCSDSNANPRYVQDTMLCVLSDSEFADKYESVVIAASSGSVSGSKWGADSPSSHEVERIALKETLHQRRSWFLIGAAALLSALTAMLFVNGFCLCLRRKVRSVSKGKSNQPNMTKTASSRPNNFWHESASLEPDDEVRHLLSSDPPTTDDSSSQPEPELTSEAGDSPMKKEKSTDPIVHLQQELPRSEIDGSLIKRRELLSTTTPDENPAGENASPFIYFKALFHRKPIVLKALSIAKHFERKDDKRENTMLTQLWGFVEEIRLNSTLSHPQLVAFYGFVKISRIAEQIDSDGVALVMEYMSQGDLNTFIQDHKRSLQQKQAKRKRRVRLANAGDGDDVRDKRVGWHDDIQDNFFGDMSSEDDYDEDIVHSDDENGNSIDEGDTDRWYWRISSDLYTSKLSIAIEVAKAVQYLHSFSQPLFHGNLSSRKVFLDSDWNVKLGDLTCCSALRRWSSSHNQNDVISPPSTIGSSTRFSGRSNGSSQTTGDEIHMDMTVWTAPEVLDGRQYTQKSDIYSFGVLLSQLVSYDCVSAEHSVMDDTDIPMLNNAHKEHSAGDSEAPTPIRLLMFRCQAFQPEVRPTADELLQELHQIERDVVEKLST
ncbi:TKL protein kinase [Phytophthora palmivora]|uniref:TKL protein kinase n=1 Tax=Phytophthora palmivora TaxID=4796 RepID=A0A2P4XM56_9STRA|nr:TKL protein kinase [Phytophthora palmivora]